jgi:hypothetical protein
MLFVFSKIMGLFESVDVVNILDRKNVSISDIGLDRCSIPG